MEVESAAVAQDTGSENEISEQQVQESEGQESQQAEEKKAIASQVRRLSDADDDAVVTVNINGEAKELTVRELKKLNSLEHVSQERLREAATMRKQVQKIVELAKTNPKEFLRETGIDPYDFAEATLAEKFEMMNMTPEQKELMELRKDKQSRQEKEEADRKRAEQEQISKYEAEESQKLDQEIGEAWKESGLPRTKYVAAQIAARMLSASKRGLKNFTAKDAAASVKEEYQNSTLETFQQMDGDAILSFLGDEVMKKIRNADVKRVTSKASQNLQSPGAKPASTQKTTFTSEHEWREHLAQMTANLKD